MNQPVKATILLLCSDPIVRLVFRDVLEAEGYVVLPAGDLGVAVTKIKQATPDLLIVRPYLDNITGHDAAVYLRTKCHGLRVLVVGAFLDDERLRYRETLKSFDVFPPVYSARQFLDKVREMLL
jgi:CheY-like chemotaxis protein